MKKYALALIALSLGMLLNAFTPVKKSGFKKSPGTPLIWYYIDGSNEINPEAPINPDDPVDETDLDAVYFACSGTGADCAKGFLPATLPDDPTDEGVDIADKAQ